MTNQEPLFIRVKLKQLEKAASMPSQAEIYDAYAEAARIVASMYPPKKESRVEIRLGDWMASWDRGSFYHVKCRTCGISGTISFAEHCDHRKKCPLCTKLAIDDWQREGYADLLPKEEKRRTFIPVGIDSVDDMPQVTPGDDGEGVTEIVESFDQDGVEIEPEEPEFDLDVEEDAVEVGAAE